MPKTNTTNKTTSATKNTSKNVSTKKGAKTMKTTTKTTSKKANTNKKTTTKNTAVSAPKTYGEAVIYLEKIFDKVNAFWFKGEEITKPTITIQSTLSAYGHVTIKEVWTENEKGKPVRKHELNIGADTLDRPIVNIVSTLIHEMVHLYCMEHDIKDTSNNHVYHNKKFKEVAENHGIIVSQSTIKPSIGFSVTEPSEELKKWVKSERLKDFKVMRKENYNITPVTGKGKGNGDDDNGDGANKPKKTKGNSIKWQCPKCKAIVRSTKAFASAPICGECYDKLGEIVRFTSEL